MTTETISHNWQHIDLTAKAEDLKEITPEMIIKGDEMDLEDSKKAYGDRPGLTLVKTLEIWSRSPDGSESEHCLSRESFIKHLNQEDSDILSAKLYADGVLATALMEAFK